MEIAKTMKNRILMIPKHAKRHPVIQVLKSKKTELVLNVVQVGLQIRTKQIALMQFKNSSKKPTLKHLMMN